MYKSALTSLALTGAMTLAGSAFAQQDSGESGQYGRPGQSAPPPMGQPGQSGQSGQWGGQAGQTTGAPGAMMGPNWQAQHQVMQQLRQIQQNPQMAGSKLFVLNAAIDNRTEIDLGRIAEQKAQNQQVKDLARSIVQGHEQLAQQLQQIGQQIGVQIPQELPVLRHEEISVLSAVPSNEFDQLYVSIVQAAHAKDIAAYQAASKISQSQPVQQFAQQTLPHLQHHQQEIDHVASAVGVPTGGQAVPTGTSGAGGESR